VDDSQPDIPEAREARVDRAILEYLEASDAGRGFDRAEFLARYPGLAPELELYLADHQEVDRLTGPLRPGDHGNEEAVDHPATPASPMGPLPGEIDGFRPIRFLGAGGMGRVYESEVRAGRRVALKLIAPGFAGSTTALERFRQEGRLAGLIAHPRCVFVLGAIEEAGQAFIAMELMSGATLKDLVERRGPLAPAEAVARILDVVEGLQQAHDLGMIHRDIKPANYYLDAEGRIKIGYFGLARSLTADAALTQPGRFLGTPLFASPEQLKAERLDARADVYSVAATLYFLLTARAPFGDSDGAAAIARIASEDPPSLRRVRPEIPIALERVVLKGLERARARRFQTLEELRDALLPFVPRELTFASLGLRLGAHCIDALPFWAAAVLVSISAIQTRSHPTSGLLLALTGPVFLCFWLCDGLLGGTPGKRLFGLRVVPSDGGQGPPGLRRGLVRTTVYLATSGLISELGLQTALDPSDQLRWGLFGIAGLAVEIGLRCCTMRASNGYRGLHEFASGTRVVRRPGAPRRRWLSGHAAAGPPLRTVHPEGLPERIGCYQVRGALRWDAGGRLLVGEDTALGRSAWIRLRSEAEEPMPAARRDLSRPTRLRWLAAGESGTWRWEAVVAPAGRPLTDWVARGPLGWSATRRVLEQLTEELVIAREDGTLPHTLTIEQVWLRPTSEVQLLDAAPGDVARADVCEGAQTPDERALHFLREVAAFGLAGTAAEDPGRPGPIRAVVPRHARPALDRLAGVGRPYGHLSEWQADLAATRLLPAEATGRHRAVQAGISSGLLVFSCLILLMWSRLAGVAAVTLIDRGMVQARALLLVLDDQVLRVALCAELPGDSLPCSDANATRRKLRRRYELDRLELASRVAALWPIVLMRPIHGLVHDGKPLQLERVPGRPFAVRVRRPNAPAMYDVRLDVRDVPFVLGHAEETGPDEFSGLRLFGWVIGCLPFSLFLAAAFLTRGGVGLRLAGLALVRSDGRDAFRLRCAWRTFTVFLPILALQWLLVWIDTAQPQFLWLWPLPYGWPCRACDPHAGRSHLAISAMDALRLAGRDLRRAEMSRQAESIFGVFPRGRARFQGVCRLLGLENHPASRELPRWGAAHPAFSTS
jgi:eukaryotic-like serine/threonine-protein kinase